MSARETAWLRQYLSEINGATIIGTDVVIDDLGIWPVLEIMLTTGEVISAEIAADPEGNGPGFLFGLAKPETKNE